MNLTILAAAIAALLAIIVMLLFGISAELRRLVQLGYDRNVLATEAAQAADTRHQAVSHTLQELKWAIDRVEASSPGGLERKRRREDDAMGWDGR